MLDYRKNLAQFLLAIWLILEGLSRALNLGFTGFHLISGALALAAGILFILGR